MRLGLLGYPLNHSKSPDLYRTYLGNKLTSYELFPFERKDTIPEISYFRNKLDGLNITSPYKTHFIRDVQILNPIVTELGVINTISFSPKGIFATNTDLIAVHKILSQFKSDHPDIVIFLLGDGAMAKLTKVVANNLKIELHQFSRKIIPDLSRLDLTPFYKSSSQPLLINSCSREFVFNGTLSGSEIFWDYNYDFSPHKNLLHSKVKAYIDGQELLKIQAISAIEFWAELTTKLK